MTIPKSKAIRITVVTAAVSLVLSAVCCAAFIFNLPGLLNAGESSKPAPAPENMTVSVVICGDSAQECAPALAY